MPDMTDSELANADFDEDGIPSGGIASTGTGVTPTTTNAPISLAMQQIREQINNLNTQLSTRTETGAELEAIKRQAYAEFLAFALDNDGVNFTKQDFADALSISVERAERDYYNFDFTDVEPLGLTYTDEVANAGDPARDKLGIYGRSVLPEGMKRSWTPSPITSANVEVPTTSGIMDAATLEKYLPTDLTRRVNKVTQNTPAYSAADKLPSTLFDAINFPEQTINRGVPVVTKGIDAAGNPTTAITMGNAAADPSGDDIGQLDISTIFPSTGMGINPDGTGTATVGTLDTTGNIVASSADTLNMLDTGLDNVSAVDPNVLSTAGGAAPVEVITQVTAPEVPTTKMCPMGTQLAGSVTVLSSPGGADAVRRFPAAFTRIVMLRVLHDFG